MNIRSEKVKELYNLYSKNCIEHGINEDNNFFFHYFSGIILTFTRKQFLKLAKTY